jgi:DNA-binding NarL/FixJ family response regulator
MTIRILIVDDHAMMRAGLAKLLADYGDCEIAGEAADGNEGVRLASELAPDLVLLDVTMPGLNGFDACKLIVESRPETKIILLTMHKAEDIVRRGFGAGAKGYVVKDAAPDELEQAVRIVSLGGTFVSPLMLLQNVKQSHRGRAEAPAGELTARERQVLQLIAEGNVRGEIADRLSISIKTVETHRMHLMRKLDIHDVASLTRYAMRIGLIAPEA